MKITLERHFQSLFGKYILNENIFCAYELKISRGNTVNFNCFQDQQIPSLWKTYTVGINIKFTDASFGLKNYDGICYKGPSYIGIMFNIPKNQKEFYLIHIKEVMKIKKSGAKSITKKDCEEFGIKRSF